MPLQDAIATLYRAPLSDFVAERKRLSLELKTAGDKELSARVAKLARPSVSAWAVNQLWWQAREDFEALLAAAARVKRGDRAASQQHRELLARLREKASGILEAAGNVASDATLRRVTTTLSAVAATGGFAPDPEGALALDRDPPGFEALEGPAEATPGPVSGADQAAEERAQEAERRRAEEQEREHRLAERERLSAALGEARELRETQQRELSRLRGELDAAEHKLRQTQALLVDIEARLANL